MPWEGTPRFALGIFTVLKQAPPESGVYALLAGETWVDIEEAENIQVCLLTHLNGPDPSIVQYDVTSFAFERVPAEARKARENELIREFHPVYHGPMDAAGSLRIAPPKEPPANPKAAQQEPVRHGTGN